MYYFSITYKTRRLFYSYKVYAYFLKFIYFKNYKLIKVQYIAIWYLVCRIDLRNC